MWQILQLDIMTYSPFWLIERSQLTAYNIGGKMSGNTPDKNDYDDAEHAAFAKT